MQKERLSFDLKDQTQENLRELKQIFPSLVSETLDEDGKEKLTIDLDSFEDIFGLSIIEREREREFRLHMKR